MCPGSVSPPASRRWPRWPASGCPDEPGLLPRSTRQAILTGLTSAVNYGLVANGGRGGRGCWRRRGGAAGPARCRGHRPRDGPCHSGPRRRGCLAPVAPPRRGANERATLRSAAWITALTGFTGLAASKRFGSGRDRAGPHRAQLPQPDRPRDPGGGHGGGRGLTARNRRAGIAGPAGASA